MSVSPYALVGSSVLERARKAAAAALATWAEAWGFAADSVSVDCTRADKHAARLNWRRHVDADERSVWIDWSSDFSGALQRVLFAPDANDANAANLDARVPRLASAAAKQALDDLLAALFGAALVGASPRSNGPDHPPGQAEFSPGAGTLMWQIQVGQQTCRCLLNAAAVRGFAAAGLPGRSPDRALRPLNYAHLLRGTSVALPVRIGEAEVRVGNLLTLAVGDVIRLSTPADSPVGVLMPDGRWLLDAYLGRIDDALAIEISARH